NSWVSKLFCFRGCRDSQNAPRLCQHIYDEMGCNWNMPGDYDTGQSTTPSAHSAPATPHARRVSTISNGITLTGTNMTATTSKTTTGTTSTRAAATGNSALLGPRIPAIGLFLAGFGIALAALIDTSEERLYPPNFLLHGRMSRLRNGH
ncbi:hypothetical protein BC826DRAFT_1084707, partial [Russula brevipes]